jgi:hypothetical protein
LSAFVTTLVSESLLVHPGEIPVPRKKVARIMNTLSLIQMYGNVIIKACLGTVGERFRCLGRQSLQTFDGADIILPLLLGKRSPKI